MTRGASSASARIDASARNGWEVVNLQNRENSARSMVTVDGGLGFVNSRFGNMPLSAGGARAGDVIEISGNYSIAANSVFKVYVDPQSGAADRVAFLSSSSSGCRSRFPGVMGFEGDGIVGSAL